MNSEQQSSSPWENCLFTQVFRTFRIAIQPSKLIMALCALALICLAGVLMDLSQSVVLAPGVGTQETELGVYLQEPEQITSFIERYSDSGERTGVFATMWSFGVRKFNSILAAVFQFNLPGVVKHAAEYFQGVAWALRYHYVYSIIFGLIKLAVLAVVGGAICRTAALQYTQDEKPGLTESLRFSLKRFVSFFAAPLAPIGITIFIGVFIFVLGLITNIPYVGELIMAVFYVLVLVAGALIAAILIGTVAGFNLMFPAIACDGTDCFDAISRAFSYIYSKPWRMGFYTGVAWIYGAICYLFVRLFAFLLLWSGYCFLALGVFADTGEQTEKLEVIWSKPSFGDLFEAPAYSTTVWTESVAAFIVTVGALVVIGLVIAFIISFYFSANTIIYALMRNRVDGTALDEVYTEPTEGEEEAETETGAAPPPTEEGEAKEETESTEGAEEEPKEPEGGSEPQEQEEEEDQS